MTEKILILDFGSQYTQLIARAVREAQVYCEIIPYHRAIDYTPALKGIILSGSPFSVNDADAPMADVADMAARLPVLGVCYGAQLTARLSGGRVERSEKREYGRAFLEIRQRDALFGSVPDRSQVWMSHGDSILALPDGFEVLATTDSIPVAAFRRSSGDGHPLYGLQFHPEVFHSEHGRLMIRNFLTETCGCRCDWTPAHFITDTVEALRTQIGDGQVVMALSGGVDSTVAATLIDRAIGDRLHGIFVDNGLLRKDEFRQVLDTYSRLSLNVRGVDAREHFYTRLAGKSSPEDKRKTIGATFIEVFDREAHALTNISFLGQGTIYPDVIESVSVHGPSVTIKSHHNVGGLPETHEPATG